MYIHLRNDVAIISNDVSDTEIALDHILKTIKATLKYGLPVVIKFKDIHIDVTNLRSKHYVANTEFAFVNISLKNRFPIEKKIESPSEVVDYMLELNTLLS